MVRKVNYFLSPSILGIFAALNVPEYISQQMFLIQFIQTRFLLAVVIHCWFPGYVWEMTRPHFPASMVGRSVPSSREYKSIMKSLRIETKNPKKTPAERCRMAVAFLLLGQVAWIWRPDFCQWLPKRCEDWESLWRGRVPSTEGSCCLLSRCSSSAP